MTKNEMDKIIKAKLEAAEKMATALEEVNLDNTGVLTWAAIRQVQAALSAWEKAAKGAI